MIAVASAKDGDSGPIVRGWGSCKWGWAESNSPQCKGSSTFDHMARETRWLERATPEAELSRQCGKHRSSRRSINTDNSMTKIQALSFPRVVYWTLLNALSSITPLIISKYIIHYDVPVFISIIIFLLFFFTGFSIVKIMASDTIDYSKESYWNGNILPQRKSIQGDTRFNFSVYLKLGRFSILRAHSDRIKLHYLINEGLLEKL